ncbi:Sec-independent protein translocase subunit TatA [Antrihabitans cavernicola]|uniref:Sec-independent protein translocase protein TatA n=1 Tax=Antrihabitans cavernicola TaxID=2495913 RepID=A0A5A7S8P8_9NOCA|nr:Sec-independent protein translocase subunit TatA [Spelaeibacter cavernicola]KAA0021297.1 Sec-independent protein translocase subunit TatA [Spelaeibacter cavernicola]
MGAMSPWHWAIVLLVVVILFGSKKLPDAARGLGQSLRIFKSEVKEMQKEGPEKAKAKPEPQQELPQSTTPATPQQYSTPDHADPKSA